jgi:hypothetical protein
LEKFKVIKRTSRATTLLAVKEAVKLRTEGANCEKNKDGGRSAAETREFAPQT